MWRKWRKSLTAHEVSLYPLVYADRMDVNFRLDGIHMIFAQSESLHLKYDLYFKIETTARILVNKYYIASVIFQEGSVFKIHNLCGSTHHTHSYP